MECEVCGYGRDRAFDWIEVSKTISVRVTTPADAKQIARQIMAADPTVRVTILPKEAT